MWQTWYPPKWMIWAYPISVFFLPKSFTRHKAIPEKTCEGFPTQPEVHGLIVRRLLMAGYK